MVLIVIKATLLGVMVLVSLTFLMLGVPAHRALLRTSAISLLSRDLGLIIQQTQNQFIFIFSMNGY